MSLTTSLTGSDGTFWITTKNATVIGDNNTIVCTSAHESILLSGSNNVIQGGSHASLSNLTIVGNHNHIIMPVRQVKVTGSNNSTFGHGKVMSNVCIGINNDFAQWVDDRDDDAILEALVSEALHYRAAQAPSSSTWRGPVRDSAPIRAEHRILPVAHATHVSISPSTGTDGNFAAPSSSSPTYGASPAPSASSTTSTIPSTSKFSVPDTADEDVATDEHTPQKDVCTLCESRVRRVVLIPCGHRYSCIACAKQHAQSYFAAHRTSTTLPCPFCRRPATSSVIAIDC